MHSVSTISPTETDQVRQNNLLRRLVEEILGLTNGQIPGTSTNDNASAGNVGEYFRVQSGSVALTTATRVDLTTQSLTAGDWDVSGYVLFNADAGTTVTAANASFSTVATTLGSDVSFGTISTAGGTLGYFETLQITPVRFSLASTTTVRLNAFAAFSGGAGVSAVGTLRARRVR